MNDLRPFDFDKYVAFSKEQVQEIIAQIEAKLAECEQTEIPIIHHFSHNVYAREMRAVAGTLLVGKIHRHQNLNILSEGEVSVLSVDGQYRVKAPYTFVASPGAKRVIYAHTDVVWTTIHGTPETDLEKIENEFIAKTYADIPAMIELKEAKCLGSQSP